MNLIDKQNQKIKEENRLGLMTHVVAGYPNLEET
ncbi:tryptophan synthase subunit alpha, partial [bacterium]|nr:tryptophan synthase subunit alpha [bacterium]